MVMLLFVFSTATYAQTCEVSQVKSVLKKALFDYLTNPNTADMSLVKVKDLLAFYLNIGSGQTTTDCSITGANSNERIADLVAQASNVIRKVPKCSDGTEYGECSTFKPKYCYAGSLLHRCNYCTCPSPSGCTTSGKCETIVNDTIVNETTACTDSDGGKNYDVKGTTSACPTNDLSGSPCTAFIDKCVNGTLTEGYCNDEGCS